MRYWWVNHDSTGDREVGGGYLWSPKRGQKGARIQFYENMSVARPGDAVLSCVDRWIRHAGVVTDRASTSIKPDSYGAEIWNKEGWRLPVRWTRLPRGVQPHLHIDEFHQLLPKKYSPIRADGNRNQVYLAEISEPVFDFIVKQGGGDPEGLKRAGRRGPRRRPRADRVSANRTPRDAPLAESEQEQVTKVRRGQGLFRIRVSQIEKKGCRLSGVQNPRLLRASHIKPWRSCTTYERLDGANGLLLTPHVDHLFDIGYISFEDSGDVKVSSRLGAEELNRLGLAEACAGNVGSFSKQQQAYLAQHRVHVFKP